MSSDRGLSGITVPGSSAAATGRDGALDAQARPLRRALLLDAVASGTMGLGVLIFADALTSILGLPVTLLRWAGVILVPFALVVAWVGTRPVVHRGAATEIVIVNVAWVVASLVLLVLPAVQATTLGSIFVIAQAGSVALFVLLQTAGIRRARM